MYPVQISNYKGIKNVYIKTEFHNCSFLQQSLEATQEYFKKSKAEKKLDARV